MMKLYTPSDESELIFIRSLLEAEGIPYYVQNEHFGSMYSGAYLRNFNEKTIMVPEEFWDEAKEMILSINDNAVIERKNQNENYGVANLIKDIINLLSLGLISFNKDNGTSK